MLSCKSFITEEKTLMNLKRKFTFKKNEEPSKWAALAGLLRGVTRPVSILSVLYLIGGGLEALFLVSIARIGIVVADGKSKVQIANFLELSIVTALAVTALLVVSRLFIALWGVRISIDLTQQIAITLRSRLSHSFLWTSWATQQNQPFGTLQQLIVTYPNQGTFIITQLAQSLGAALTLTAMLVVAFLVDPWTFVAVAGVLLLLSLVLYPLRARVRAHSLSSVDPQLMLSNGISEVGLLGLEIQTFGVRAEIESHVNQLIGQDAVAQRRMGMVAYSVSPLYLSLAYVSVLGALGFVAAQGSGALQQSGAVMLVMLRMLSYGQVLQQGSVYLNQLAPFMNQIEKTISDFETNRATDGSIQIAKIGTIALSNISFSFEPGRKVIKDISCSFNEGETYGIIGPSGSGKSTLVQLLLGIRDPDEGQIEASGIDLRLISRRNWNSRVAFVPQNANLITGTIAENIRFFRTGISDEEVIEAARAANFLDEIEKIPYGIEANIGGRGQQLSGGQQQRLSIARALVGKPQLLILDEPTSALDVKSESIIRKTILELKDTVTVVIVAHRITTLDICNRLLVIQDGHLKAFDSPKELALKNEFYKETLRLSGLT
jgi:ATP-binding cassette, subfamily B, bacterial